MSWQRLYPPPNFPDEIAFQRSAPPRLLGPKEDALPSRRPKPTATYPYLGSEFLGFLLSTFFRCPGGREIAVSGGDCS